MRYLNFEINGTNSSHLKKISQYQDKKTNEPQKNINLTKLTYIQYYFLVVKKLK